MMRKFGYFLIVALLCCTGDLHAQLKGNKVPTVEEMLNNTAQGREFWIAMPPNEATGVNIIQRALEIYVTSSVDTEVTIEMPGLGFGPLTKQVKALEITTFSGEANELSWAMEVRESDIVTEKGLKITADDPVSVYVLSAKRFCSEGYLALPTNVWDRRYMHIGYYDYPEAQTVRGGGFIVVAKEDETSVVITLDGSTAGGTTVGGKRIGQRFNITLNEGQTYMIRGTGIDRAFDMTGTSITATKPVGLIAFHERTIIPTAMGSSSRDNLMAMIPPSTTWGKTYISLEFFRENTGDYFRILASQPNTEYTVRYYEKDNNRDLIAVRNGLLSERGDWAEFEEVNPQGGAVSIRGTAIWDADKPVFVMQYSYSSGWDGNQDFDPFMVQVVPQEQYIPATVFQTPSNAEFNTNWFNIIAEMDPDDPRQETLRSIKLDGTPIADRDPLFLVNEIPGTGLTWARVNVPPGAHQVTSNGKARFGGYIYGFSRFESYGWPAAMALNKLDELDTVPPPVEIEEDCGTFCVLTTEETNGAAGDDPRQIDQGVSAINMIEGTDEENPRSYNFELEFKTSEELKPDPKVTRFEFCFNVIDLEKDAKAVFTVLDRAGNVTIDSVQYTADRIEMRPAPVLFGNVLLGTSGDQQATLFNPTSKRLEVRKVELKDGSLFTIVGPQRVLDATAEAPLFMEPLEEITLELRYTPEDETEDLNDEDAVDRDMIVAETACLEWELGEVIGRGVTPAISVEDYNVGIQAVGRTICKNTTGQAGVVVRNRGTADLEISAVNVVFASSGDINTGPFTWAAPGMDPAVPPTFTIAPGEEQLFQTICFNSDVEAEHEFRVEFESNAREEFAREYKPISVWTGETIKSAPSVTFYDFGQVRVGATVPRNPVQGDVSVVEFINFGEQEVRFRPQDIQWEGEAVGDPVAGPFTIVNVYRKSEEGQANSNLLEIGGRFGMAGIDPDSDPSTWDESQIYVALIQFNPTAEGIVTRTIIPPFYNTQADTERIGRDEYTGSGEVAGEGIIPKTSSTGYDFLEILCGTESEEQGFVTITNDADASEDLTVYGLSFEAQGGLANFAWGTVPDAQVADEVVTFIPQDPEERGLVLAPGESFQVPVVFTANGGPYTVDVTIEHDAHENDFDLVARATTVVQVTGSCDSPGGLTVNGLDYGNVLLCAEPTDIITVTTDNASGAEITGLSLEGNNPHFEILTPTPITIPGNGSVDIEIRFTPSDEEAQSDVVIIENSLGPPLRAPLFGDAHTVTVEFDLEDDPTLLTPGDEIELDLTISNFDEIDPDREEYNDTEESGLAGVIVTLNYDLGAARLTEVRPEAGFTLEGQIDHSRIDGFSKFTLRAGAPIDRELLLARLNFQLYLHDDETLPIEMTVEILETDREKCVIAVPFPGSLRINPICLNNGRFISLSGTTFGLRNVTPNPVVESTTIAYSVGFRTHTNIVIYNAMGETVKVLVDQPLDAGVYESDLNVSELPSGVYTYTMTAGPYSQAHTLVITK